MTIGSVLASWGGSQRRDRLPPSLPFKRVWSRTDFKLRTGLGAEQESLSTSVGVSSRVRGAHFLLISCHQRIGSRLSLPSEVEDPPRSLLLQRRAESAHVCAPSAFGNTFPSIFTPKCGIYRLKQNAKKKKNQSNTLCSLRQ